MSWNNGYERRKFEQAQKAQAMLHIGKPGQRRQTPEQRHLH